MPLRRIPPRAIVLVLLIFSVCSVEPVNAFPFSARQSAMVSTMAKSVIVQISGMEKPFATYHESSYGLTVRYRQEAGDLLRTQGGK